MEFSRKGDEVFSSLASKFPNAARHRLMFVERLDADRFEAIRLGMLAFLSACVGSNKILNEDAACAALLAKRGQLPNYTPGGMLAPKREHTLEFNLLHRAVAAAFSDYDIGGLVEGIDLPINVRLVYGQADPTRLGAPFASSKRHSDVWAGVPADAAVVVLPVVGDIDHIYVECAEMPRELELGAMRAMSDYDEGRDVPAVVPYEGGMKLGHLYVADARLLHWTVRKRASGVRVSVDLRFRFNDRAYREMTPKIEAGGPDSVDARVPYGRWLRVGSDEIIAFPETMEQARATKAVSSSPINTAEYHLLRTCEGP